MLLDVLITFEVSASLLCIMAMLWLRSLLWYDVLRQPSGQCLLLQLVLVDGVVITVWSTVVDARH